MLNKLIKNKTASAGLWYLLGSFSVQGIAVISIPIFTRVMTTTEFGLYSVYFSYVTMFSMLVGLSVYVSIMVAKHEFVEKQFDGYISSILTLSVIVFIIVVVGSNLFFRPLQSLLGFERFLFNCLLLHSYGTFVFHCAKNVYVIEMQHKKYIALTMFWGLSTAILPFLLFATIYTDNRYLGRIIGSAIPAIVFGAWYLLYSILKGKCFFSKKYWKFALAISLPMIPYELSLMVIGAFDRIMIERFTDASYAGIYALVHGMGAIIALVNLAFSNVWRPWFSEHLNNNNYAKIRKYLAYVLTGYSILVVSVIAVSYEAVMIFAPREFWVGKRILLPVMLAQFSTFLWFLTVFYLYFKKKTAIIGISATLCAIVSIALNYIFIPIFGFEAAAYTTLISFSLMFIFQWIAIRDSNKNKIYDIKAILLTILFITAASSVISFFADFVLLRYGVFVVIMGVFLVAKRKQLIEMKMELFGHGEVATQ